MLRRRVQQAFPNCDGPVVNGRSKVFGQLLAHFVDSGLIHPPLITYVLSRLAAAFCSVLRRRSDQQHAICSCIHFKIRSCCQRRVRLALVSQQNEYCLIPLFLIAFTTCLFIACSRCVLLRFFQAKCFCLAHVLCVL